MEIHKILNVQWFSIAKMVGRPIAKVELNFHKIDQTISNIKLLLETTSNKDKIHKFAQDLNSLLYDTKDNECQTDAHDFVSDQDCQTEEIRFNDQLKEHIEICTENQILEMIDILFESLSKQEQLVCSFAFFEDLESDLQVLFFALLGHLFNEQIYKQTLQNIKRTNKTNFDELSYASKKSLFESADPRLQAFLKSMTEKEDSRNTSDNTNYLTNIIENILKARNQKCVTIQGVREGVTAYISSNRSKTTSTIMNKQGAKGSMPFLKRIIQNTVDKNEFKPPPDCIIMLSFDNIQRLQKSYHITSSNTERPLAIVVTSALCTLPDGYSENKLQYNSEYAPSNWQTSYLS